MSDDPVLAALARLESGQAGMRADITGLRGEFTGIRIDLSDELGRTRAAIMEKIAELNASVVAIRDDIAINMGAADAMQKANDNTRELVRLQAEQMSLMRKQIKQLQADVRNIKGTP